MAETRSSQAFRSGINTRESTPGPGRVSSYNPESVLVDLADVPENEPAEGMQQQFRRSTTRPRIGTTQASEPSPSAAAQRAHRQLMWYKKHRRRPEAPKLSESHRLYLEEEGAFLELPRSTADALLPIYVMLLDDLLPIMDGSSVFRDYSNGKSSSYLVRAICLVICKAKQAEPFLRVRCEGPVLKPLEFASKLLVGLDAAMKADLEPDRVTKVQVLALMHLHNDGPSGVDRASSYLSQAICEAWAMSLHWKIPGNMDQDRCDLLWWSLRNLDRLNKSINWAAPFIIDDSDVGIDRIVSQQDSYRSKIMGMTLKLGDLMATATKSYKASSKIFIDRCLEFESFSQLVQNTDFDCFHSSHRAYLEIWYHVAAMLSCKYGGPATALYNRRLSSADRILDIITYAGHENLPPLPLVPYAMAMSTTILYRALRDGQRDVETARSDLRRCCDVLDGLSSRWTTAKGVAKLAKRLLNLLVKSANMGRKPARRAEKGYGTSRLLPAQRQLSPRVSAMTHTNGTDGDMSSLGQLPATAPVELPISNVCPQDQQLHSNDQCLTEQSAIWPELDASYSRLDTAFHDMFDYGMPNIFRDASTWEFFQLASGDDGSPGDSELQFSSYLSSPEMEFGYQGRTNSTQGIG